MNSVARGKRVVGDESTGIQLNFVRVQNDGLLVSLSLAFQFELFIAVERKICNATRDVRVLLLYACWVIPAN